MCDWNPAELLGDWRERARPELETLGGFDLTVTEDGWKATLALKRGSVVTSITAWSTGMIELVSSGGDPEVVTEQRDSRSAADSLLDEWLRRLITSPSVPADRRTS